MAIQLVVLLVLVAGIPIVHCNVEGNVLNAWKSGLSDPYNVLQSWDPTLVNPCMWLHVTCNSDNSVVRLDLGNAGLSGPLIPQLALLRNLKEIYGNNLTGSIPKEFGKLTKLVSLDLYRNKFSGKLPASLGNLASLRFMRLNSNKLSGSIPIEVPKLIPVGNLQIMRACFPATCLKLGCAILVFLTSLFVVYFGNVSDNSLAGTVRTRKAIVTSIIQDPKAQK